jgi:hypothetical protein
LLLPLLASIACAAEDLLADLRAEVAAIVASATLKSAVHTKGDGGPKYANTNVVLKGDEATYELVYKSFLPPHEARSRAELNDWASGLGMLQPSVYGWYSNGFVEVVIQDAKLTCTISDRLGTTKLVQEQGKIVAVDYDWQLDNGAVKLRFFMHAQRPELFLQVTAKPLDPQATLSVAFTCFPGGFVAPFDRHVHTALQDFPHGGEGEVQTKLDPAQEPWLLLADHYLGITPRPMGPCSIVADPEGLATAGARIKGNYMVNPMHTLKPGATAALFAIREFPPTPWPAAQDELAAGWVESLQAARAALDTLPH